MFVNLPKMICFHFLVYEIYMGSIIIKKKIHLENLMNRLNLDLLESEKNIFGLSVCECER